jgi:hypothetical protein
MLLGLLETLLLGVAGLLLALGLEIVSCDLIAVTPAEQTERSGEQPTQGTATGARGREGLREAIEAGSIH